MNDEDQNQPVVLITGALAGIGRATALAFARNGARLVISGRRDEAGQQLLRELKAQGSEAEFVRADVRHEDEVRHLVETAATRFGSGCRDQQRRGGRDARAIHRATLGVDGGLTA